MTLEDVVASSNRSIEKSSIANFSRQRFLHLSSLEKGNFSIFRRFVDESTPEFSTTALSNFCLSHSLSLSRSHSSLHTRNFSRTHAQIYSYTRKVSLSLSLFLSSFVRDSRIDRIIPKTHEFCQGRFLLS